MKISIEIPDDGGIAEAFARVHNWDGVVNLETYIHGVLLSYIKQRSVEGLVSTEVKLVESQKKQQVDAAPINVSKETAK